MFDFGSLAGAYWYDRIASLTISLSARSDRSFSDRLNSKAGWLQLSPNMKYPALPALSGAKEWEPPPPVTSISTGLD